MGDGTAAQQHWDSPLSGARTAGRRGHGSRSSTRRACGRSWGASFCYSRHLPDDVQGQFIYACVINMNGLTAVRNSRRVGRLRGGRVTRQVAGENGETQAGAGRPAGPARTRRSGRSIRRFGPDGALWFGDWCNALIGHMQYSQRDPNRDHQHGRIYRLVYTKRPLLEPVMQHDKSGAGAAGAAARVRAAHAVPSAAGAGRSAARRRAGGGREWVAGSIRPIRSTTAAVRGAVGPAAAARGRRASCCATCWSRNRRMRVRQPRTSWPTSATICRDALALLAARVRRRASAVRLEAIRGLSFFPTHGGGERGTCSARFADGFRGSRTRWSTRSSHWNRSWRDCVSSGTLAAASRGKRIRQRADRSEPARPGRRATSEGAA